MKEGDVVLATIPQADRSTKKRPAIVLREMPQYGDLLICGVSTHLKQLVPNFDEIIEPPNADFPTNGLKSASLIRMGFLTVLPCGRIIGSIGSIAPDRHRRLLKTISDYLVK